MGVYHSMLEEEELNALTLPRKQVVQVKAEACIYNASLYGKIQAVPTLHSFLMILTRWSLD